MICPSCATPMEEHRLSSRLGTPVVVDVCARCQAFWFDGRESLQLSPGATLQLFGIIGRDGAQARQPLSAHAACPRCGLRLRPTEDLQRATRFRYLRCPRGDGRLISFFDFLREKDFIRPLSSDRLAELRAHVETVNCSNCGAPVDLSRSAACAHCRSPLSMLDLRHAADLVEQLRRADARQGSVSPDLPLDLLASRREAERLFDQIERDPRWYREASAAGTVSATLAALGRWMSRR
jgi:hypothetical protein